MSPFFMTVPPRTRSAHFAVRRRTVAGVLSRLIAAESRWSPCWCVTRIRSACGRVLKPGRLLHGSMWMTFPPHRSMSVPWPTKVISTLPADVRIVSFSNSSSAFRGITAAMTAHANNKRFRTIEILQGVLDAEVRKHREYSTNRGRVQRRLFALFPEQMERVHLRN